jgi:hypothetical protein
MLPLPSSVVHRAQAARLTALCAAFALSGCAAIKQASLRDTEVFYRASTLDVYAPKPATVEIPILNAMPPRSKSIGSFRYTSKKGSQFAMDAAVHNARRVGADAVLVRKLDERTEPFSYYVPPETVSVPRTRPVDDPIWIKGQNGEPGHWEYRRRYETIYVLEQRPGHMVTGTNHWTTIDALMLRQK